MFQWPAQDLCTAALRSHTSRPVNTRGHLRSPSWRHRCPPSVIPGLAQPQNAFGAMKSKWQACFRAGFGGETKWCACCPRCFCLSAQPLRANRRHLRCTPDAGDPEAPPPPGSGTASRVERRDDLQRATWSFYFLFFWTICALVFTRRTNRKWTHNGIHKRGKSKTIKTNRPKSTEHQLGFSDDVQQGQPRTSFQRDGRSTRLYSFGRVSRFDRIVFQCNIHVRDSNAAKSKSTLKTFTVPSEDRVKRRRSSSGSGNHSGIMLNICVLVF